MENDYKCCINGLVLKCYNGDELLFDGDSELVLMFSDITKDTKKVRYSKIFNIRKDHNVEDLFYINDEPYDHKKLIYFINYINTKIDLSTIPNFTLSKYNSRVIRPFKNIHISYGIYNINDKSTDYNNTMSNVLCRNLFHIKKNVYGYLFVYTDKYCKYHIKIKTTNKTNIHINPSSILNIEKIYRSIKITKPPRSNSIFVDRGELLMVNGSSYICEKEGLLSTRPYGDIDQDETTAKLIKI